MRIHTEIEKKWPDFQRIQFTVIRSHVFILHSSINSTLSAVIKKY